MGDEDDYRMNLTGLHQWTYSLTSALSHGRDALRRESLSVQGVLYYQSQDAILGETQLL